jgi:hypothetical protein
MIWPGSTSENALSAETIAHLRSTAQLLIDEGALPTDGIVDALRVLDSKQARQHPEAVGLLLLGSTTSFLAQRDTLGMALASAALEVALAQGDLTQTIRAHTHLGVHYSTRGHRTKALRHLTTSVQMADEAGQAEGQMRGRINLLHWLTRIGLLRDACGVADAVQARGLINRVPELAGVFCGTAARLQMYCGNAESTMHWALQAQAYADQNSDLAARAVVANLQAAWLARQQGDLRDSVRLLVWAERRLVDLTHRDREGIDVLRQAINTAMTGSSVDIQVECGRWLRQIRGYTAVHPDDLQVVLNNSSTLLAGDRVALLQHEALVAQLHQMISADGTAQSSGLGVLKWTLDVADRTDSDEYRLEILRAQSALSGTCLRSNRDWLKPLQALSVRMALTMGLSEAQARQIGRCSGATLIGQLALAPALGRVHGGRSGFQDDLLREYPRLSAVLFERLVVGEQTEMAAHLAACAEESWDGRGPLGYRMQDFSPEAVVMMAGRDWLRASGRFALAGTEADERDASQSLHRVPSGGLPEYMGHVMQKTLQGLEANGAHWVQVLAAEAGDHPCDRMLAALESAQI